MLPPPRARPALLLLALAYLAGALVQPAFAAGVPALLFVVFALMLFGLAAAVPRLPSAQALGLALVGAAAVAAVQIALGGGPLHLFVLLLGSAGATREPRVPLLQAALGAAGIAASWPRVDPALLAWLVVATLVAVLGVVERRHLHQERDGAMRRLEAEATRDELTGLLNRRGLVALGSALLGATRGRPAALLYVDVDGLKPINDRLGHAAGDRLLQEAARRLEACCRGTDLVARLGGDEYAVLLAGASVGAAERVAAQVREHVAGEIAGLPWTVSVGVAAVEGRLHEALDAADQRMYQQKHGRRKAG